MRYVAVTLSILLVTFELQARKCVISGYVTDDVSFETLISATVYDSISGTGVVTNSYGFYSLVVSDGMVALRSSYVGYQPEVLNLKIEGDTTINFKLKTVILEGVEIVAHENAQMNVNNTQMSVAKVPVSMANKIPTLAGEKDIVKAIQLMPGVQSGSEGTTGLYVRGGGPDENLVILDGVPLYNINHAMGLFSVFNSDAIKNVTLYKGGFLARFGGRLSSILDVRQNDGNAQQYHGTVSVGLIAAKASVEGPIWKEHTTFNLSFRRTYFDVLSQPIIAAVSAQEGTPVTAGYYFYDINAKVSHKFNDHNRLTASFYMGDDGIYMNSKDKEYGSEMGAQWRWGNILAAVNWTHVFTPEIFSEMMVSYSQYRYNLTMRDAENNNYYNNEFKMGLNSMMSDVSFKYNFDYKPHKAHNIKFGAEYTYHLFKPSVMSAYNIEASEIKLDMDTIFGNKPIHNHEAALYFEDDWSIHRVFKLNLGLRGSIYNSVGKTYPSIEPRVGLRVLITDDFSFKASYSYMTQYVHMLSSSNVTLPTDLWVPVTDKVPPMNSHQVAGGFFYQIPGIMDISLEGYYKQMNNVVEYRDGASYISIDGDWQSKVAVGEGYSYGIELLLQRSIGKFTGWIGYTWSRSLRRFCREGMVINNGNVFPAKYDREHDLSICLQYAPIKLIDVSATFIYGTGTCGTLPMQVTPDGVPVVSSRNNYRMPDYHRMDVAINFHFDRKHRKDGTPRSGEHQLNISCYNVYNNKNPYMIYIEDDKLMKISIFPILPSIGYTFKF